MNADQLILQLQALSEEEREKAIVDDCEMEITRVRTGWNNQVMLETDGYTPTMQTVQLPPFRMCPMPATCWPKNKLCGNCHGISDPERDSA